MNIQHMKYAVEVASTSSLNKAAENLFISQPNLSRAIRELEESLGITIFKRTSKGVTPTHQGEEFLDYARNILAQIEEVESLYRKSNDSSQRFSISVPRASYISHAFTHFVNRIDHTREMELYYKETNSMRAVNNMMQENFDLAIIRYQSTAEPYFSAMFREKNLISSLIWEFSYLALMSKNHVLADKEDINLTDLSSCIEIAHGDPYVPSMPIADVRKLELSEFVDKRIFIFERGIQFELLSSIENTYMWVSPIPQQILEQNGLVLKRCGAFNRKYRDVLIHKKEYRLTPLDRMFLEELEKSKAAVQAPLPR